MNTIAEKFVLFICSNGSKDYVEKAMEIISPGGELVPKCNIFAREDFAPGPEGLHSKTYIKQITELQVYDPQVCIVFDDRKDVWPAEYQSQLLLVEPYRYLQENVRALRQYADRQQPPLEDYDQYFFTMAPILTQLHERFFTRRERMSVGQCLRQLQATALRGVRLGMEHRDLVDRKLLAWAKAAGAVECRLVADDTAPVELRGRWETKNGESCTHFLTHTPNSAVAQAVFRDGNSLVLHPKWLQMCFATWRRVDEQFFFADAHREDEPLWRAVKKWFPPHYESRVVVAAHFRKERKRKLAEAEGSTIGGARWV